MLKFYRKNNLQLEDTEDYKTQELENVLKKKTALSIISRQQAKPASQMGADIKKIEENYKRKIETLQKENKELEQKETDLYVKLEMLRDTEGKKINLDADSVISWMSGGTLLTNRSAIGAKT